MSRASRKHYSEAELAFIRERSHWPRAAIAAEFATTFGRQDITTADITGLCKREHWQRVPRLSDTEKATIRRMYPDHSAEEIGRHIGRAETSVYGFAHREGLTKSAAFLASSKGGRIQPGERRARATEFKPGQTSPNRGLRRPGYAPGRMAETQFKAGRKTWKWKPIGSTRISQGYSFTKVADVTGVSWTQNWKQTHIVNWEATNGPLPEGYVLKSRDGNALNLDPSNWQAIPRGVLPMINGGRGAVGGLAIHEAPEALRPTIIAVAMVKHAAGKVKRRARATA